MFHKCTTQYIIYYSRNIDPHCICGLIVRLVYPLATSSSTIPGSGSPCRSPTQSLVHLAPTDLVHRPAQQPGDHNVCSGSSTQAMAPLAHVESSKSLQTRGNVSPAACVCPYVGRQPPILNLLPLRYLLTFINFVTPPPKGCSIASPLQSNHCNLASDFDLVPVPHLGPQLPLGGWLVGKVRRMEAFVEILLRQNTWAGLSPEAYKDSIDATLIVC